MANISGNLNSDYFKSKTLSEQLAKIAEEKLQELGINKNFDLRNLDKPDASQHQGQTPPDFSHLSGSSGGTMI